MVIESRGNHRLAVVILSDMLMSTYGDSIIGHYRSMNIYNDVLTYSDEYLEKNGYLLWTWFVVVVIMSSLYYS